MPDEPRPEPVLAAELAPWANGPVAGLAIGELIGRTVLRLEWRAGEAGQPDFVRFPPPGQSLVSGNATVLRASPLSALVVSDCLSPPALAETWCVPGIAVVDVSHGHAVLRLEGVAARPLLDGLVPVNLAEQVFPSGHLRRSRIAGHDVTLHCIAATGFDLYVDRSLAWSLWQHLGVRLGRLRG